MQQFTVPQFIDVEDKIIGPITTRQFLIMMTGAIMIAICYKILDFSAFLFSGVLIFALSGIFSFLKINGRPFHFFILNLIQTLQKPRLRIWNHIAGRIFLEQKKALGEEFSAAKNLVAQPLMPYSHKYYSRSRLAELSLIVDTRGAFAGERAKTNVLRPGVKDMDIL